MKRLGVSVRQPIFMHDTPSRSVAAGTERLRPCKAGARFNHNANWGVCVFLDFSANSQHVCVCFCWLVVLPVCSLRSVCSMFPAGCVIPSSVLNHHTTFFLQHLRLSIHPQSITSQTHSSSDLGPVSVQHGDGFPSSSDAHFTKFSPFSLLSLAMRVCVSPLFSRCNINNGSYVPAKDWVRFLKYGLHKSLWQTTASLLTQSWRPDSREK